MQEPFVYRTPTDFATLFAHHTRGCVFNGYIIDRAGEDVLQPYLRLSARSRKTFDLHTTLSLQNAAAAGAWIGRPQAQVIWAELRCGLQGREFLISWTK